MSFIRNVFIVIVSFGLLLIAQKEAAAFYVGVGTHIDRQNVAADFDAIGRLGANSFRDDLFWNQTELQKNVYTLPHAIEQAINVANKRGVKPLIILDYGNKLYDGGNKPVTADGLRAFSQFAAQMAKQLKGKVVFYEIWNEWDHSGKPTTSSEAYLELVKAASFAIREVDPNIKILAGAVTTAGIQNGWDVRLVQLGVLHYVDGISLHPYVHCAKDRTPEAWIRFVKESMDKLGKANGSLVPVYITEMGWPTYDGKCGVSQDIAGQYTARALFLARTLPMIKGMWIYDIKDDGDDIAEMEYNFGLLDFRYNQKPVFQVVRDSMVYALREAAFTQTTILPEVEMVTIDNKGSKTYVLWTTGRSEVKLSIILKRLGGRKVEVIRVGGYVKSLIPVEGTGTRTVITINGYPTVLSGASDIQIAGVLK